MEDMLSFVSFLGQFSRMNLLRSPLFLQQLPMDAACFINHYSALLTPEMNFRVELRVECIEISFQFILPFSNIHYSIIR